MGSILTWTSFKKAGPIVLRLGTRWDFFKKRVHDMAMRLPVIVRERMDKDAGINWSNILFIRVIFLSGRFRFEKKRRFPC